MRKRIAKLGKRNIILVPRWLLPSLLILIVLKMLMIFRSGDSGFFIFYKRPWGLRCCFCRCYSPGWDHRGADEMAQERLDSHGPRVRRSIKGNVESWISSAEFWKSYRILTISFGITLGYLLLMTQLVSLVSCSPGCPGTYGHGGWGLAGAHRSGQGKCHPFGLPFHTRLFLQENKVSVSQSHRCRSWRGKETTDTTAAAALLGSGDKRRPDGFWDLPPAKQGLP